MLQFSLSTGQSTGLTDIYHLRHLHQYWFRRLPYWTRSSKLAVASKRNFAQHRQLSTDVFFKDENRHIYITNWHQYRWMPLIVKYFYQSSWLCTRKIRCLSLFMRFRRLKELLLITSWTMCAGGISSWLSRRRINLHSESLRFWLLEKTFLKCCARCGYQGQGRVIVFLRYCGV